MNQELYNIVYQLISTNFEFSQEIKNIQNDDNLMELGLDSIGMVKIVLGIEEMCGITIPDEDLIFDNFSSIEKIVKYIEEIKNEI